MYKCEICKRQIEERIPSCVLRKRINKQIVSQKLVCIECYKKGEENGAL